MTVKEILAQPEKDFKKYQLACDTANNFRIQAGIKPHAGDGAKSSAKVNTTEAAYVCLLVLDERAEQARLKWAESLQAAQKLIDLCPVVSFWEVLEYRYLQGLTFEEIARKMHCSVNNIFKKHQRGIETLESLSSKLQ